MFCERNAKLCNEWLYMNDCEIKYSGERKMTNSQVHVCTCKIVYVYSIIAFEHPIQTPPSTFK